MSKRKITNLFNVDFKPFDNYGVTVPGMSWHKISYDKQNGGYGTYILKMEPDAKSLHHVHTGYEEFLMLEGELTDLDGKIFKKGDFVTFEPGSTHSSHTKEGCLILVFMRGINKPL
ncbi:cupin domain-containing protein [Candidatus Pelagibacter bacterium]|jgi:anti-sigma factor ChrR (cupin superfamily)|nr:cupin domain-containing protein [Candidatus Pelagibacter sp.]MDB2527261.1 cupin domain-containing protein [Candidatus Pelagibacter bacterium]MDC0427783.1 cupin domain-containing protein [Candidatus Pelagibacter sp.]MDC1082571.1 cupin domain-containing protein [Candidatus Pelagibacter sp.]|tara:strand:+ start:226 stop:573 length:348 start_codon:yes stop_codon:yes gene_type:complete